MNLIEALQELANGKKIRKRCWNKEQYLTIDKDGLFDDGLNFLTPSISIDSLCDIKMDYWEIYKPKISDKEQWNLDAIKFRIINACSDNIFCQCCPIEKRCASKSVFKDSPKDGYLIDWTKKEIIEAYKLLKEVE